ncbi:MAG: hypothetical protein QNJ14_16990 [Woeseiaceae bacterium]|nr:hypothetical protein [Woeseiaceae bacterium]
MRTFVKNLLVTTAMLAAAHLAAADGRELSDAELDAVVAGTVPTQIHEELLSFSYVGAAGSRHVAKLDGTLSMTSMPLSDMPTGILTIDNDAQNNLRALVNVNAVNSNVNVLLNLNISINSTVHEVRQINIGSE